ncbi:sulfatase [Pelagicoccus mobilis]|uniref:Sulfatase n=1 Tax=Pelagicoccus mobilis TaxID=415221 RepID=A0A934RZL7_9BACT|nr:sulfatase [Pelagicoccus mobilis]MBK1878249.1 sulfatase [Pelagicoccus mobilis]
MTPRLLCVLFLLACPFFQVASSEQKQPNVLFLSIDDLKPLLGCYGAEQMVTPHIDVLAERGTLFERHYVQQAVCAPSRVSMFTGLRPDTTRVWDLKTYCKDVCPQAFTMQEFFKNAGYTTAGAGKIMHGFRKDDPPSWSMPYVPSEELEYADGQMPALYCQYQGEAIHDAYEKLLAEKIKAYGAKQKFMSALGAKPSTERLDLADDAYADGAMVEWGIDMLERFAESGESFFLTLGFRKPHLPFVAPEKYWKMYDRDSIDTAAFTKMPKGAPNFGYQPGFEIDGYSDIDVKTLNDDFDKQCELIHGYYACVSYVDALVGEVITTLDETGLADNTVVVLWGDHGWHLGDHSIWCKHGVYEQATHSPLIVVAPDGKGGQRVVTPVESIDIFPTLCELAGLDVPTQLEGVSLVEALDEPSTELKPFALSQFKDWKGKDLMGYAQRTERYRMITWIDRSVSENGKFDASLVEAIELYDYEVDPLETVNLAKNPEYAEIITELSSLLEKHFSES